MMQEVLRRNVAAAVAAAWLLGLFSGAACRTVAADDAAPQAIDAQENNPFPGRFPAPSLDGGVAWLNTSGEISLKDLRGKVVLLDFWTYCCINCIHVLPDLKFLEDKYRDQLVVIGVHAAKFDAEKETENIREAVLRYEIEHPVVNDANMTIARKYMFNSWPTLVVIDPEGNFVGRTSGEGQRELLDHVVGSLVKHHRAKGTLDETPVRFDLEQGKMESRPLKFPGKLLADPENNRLFISDSNHNRIVIASLDGKLLEVIGTGEIGAANGGYDEAQFDHPQGMALDGETLYIADTENHLIRMVDLQEKKVSVLAGTGEQSRIRVTGGRLRTTALNSPWALTVLNRVLYIAMAGPHQLWKHDLGSKTVEVFAGTGREDITDGFRDASALAQPSGITHDGKLLYFVDSEGSAVRQVETGPRGRVTTIAGPRDLERGRSLFEFGDIDAAGEEARLQHPIGIVYHEGALFVADTYNHKIKRVDPKTSESTTWLGTGEQGKGLDPVQMDEPAGLAIAAGKLYIADTNNHRILVTDLETKATSELKIEGLTPPAPPEIKTSDDADQLAATAVPQQTIAAGQPVKFVLKFDFPEGYKLNSLSSVIWKLDAVGEQSLIAAEHLGEKREAPSEGTETSFEAPLTGGGEGTFDLSVSYQYCRDGEGGVCKLGTARYRIPVSAAAGAEAAPVTLTVKP